MRDKYHSLNNTFCKRAVLELKIAFDYSRDESILLPMDIKQLGLFRPCLQFFYTFAIQAIL